MAIAGRRAIDRMQQVQFADDRERAQVEYLAHSRHDPVDRHGFGAEAVQADRGGLGHADRIADLDLAALGQTGRHDVLGNPTTRIGRRTVYLGRILARERAAAMTGHAAIAVDDDLAPGQAAIADGTADDELAGGVDEELGGIRQPFRGQDRADDLLDHRLAQVGQADLGVVLGGQHDRVDPLGAAVGVIAQRQLRFGIRAQPGQGAVAPHRRLAFDQAMGIGDRGGHQHVGLVAGIAEHQALVACALLLKAGAVDALVDLGRLLADDVDDRTGRPVKAHIRRVIADVGDHPAHDGFQIHPGTGGDLSRDDGDAGLDHGLARHAGARVLGQDGVQDRVRNLVGDLVGMALGHGFRGEGRIFCHDINTGNGRI